MAIDATVGGPNANSYETLVEAQAYFLTRLPLAGWDDAADQSVLLIMATRVLNAVLRPAKTLVLAQGGNPAFYRTRRTWTGAPASSTQRLAWPRTGMYDANGNAIPSNVIPQDLKDAESELAGQLGTSDRTLDNDVIVQGLTSVRAGSVALTFKDMIETHVLPDAVWLLMPPSWFTDEIITPAWPAEFDVVS
jgi:hypothetical protein